MISIKSAFKECIRRIEMHDLDGLTDLIERFPKLRTYSLRDSSLLSKSRDYNPEVMSVILEAGVNPNLVDTTGSTLLMDFAALGDSTRLSLLIKHGALVNLANHHGETAFSFACARDQLTCAKIWLFVVSA